jgi:methionyl-tRNA synthetase
VEVLFVDHAQAGDRIVLSGAPSAEAPAQIDIDTFFAMPIGAENSRVVVGDSALECGGKPLVTSKVSKGRVK